MPDAADSLLSSAELGRVLGVTPARIRQLVGEGILTREGKKYPLGANVQAFIAHRSVTGADVWKERKLRAAALHAELYLAQAEEVHTDPMQVWPRVCAVVGGHIRQTWNLLSTLPPRLVNIRDPYDVQAALEAELRPLLDRLSAECNAEAPEPHATRFREERAAEDAAIAALRAADAERGARV